MRRVILFTLLVASYAAVGCGEASGPDAFGIEDVLGTWSLTSINGQSVPGTVTLDGGSYDIQYFRFTFSEAGTCVLGARVDGDVAITPYCEYTVNLEQKRITVELYGSDVLAGSIDGSRMTLTNPDDHVWIFRRQ